ncbi:hypothetical protein [Streptomyces formicae]|uniref:Mobile element protein n=1 Tax=Streptomyces formicae TaxID=1616117 RepID=A0ABY3WI67_9ACTN|nr:hypothetical protein [Streptomyces formicae]UNM12289.1 hypothetical protein J4032_12785 [Streptomyces formicae]
MARDKGRLDLREDIRKALEPYIHEDVPANATTAILAAVLPHFEAAYQRGMIAGRSQAGYQTRRKPREET